MDIILRTFACPLSSYVYLYKIYKLSMHLKSASIGKDGVREQNGSTFVIFFSAPFCGTISINMRSVRS